MSYIAIVEMTAPKSSGWQADHDAAYGPFEHADGPEIRRLRRMAAKVHGVAAVTVMRLQPMPPTERVIT